MSEVKTVTLIIPAYKQQKTIKNDIRLILKTFSALPYKLELIVVVDGFLDKTMQNAKQIRDKKVHVIGYKENHGKGYAIRYGVDKAKGDIIGFIDAGMDISPTEISMMLDIMQWNKADIVIGSKLHPDSKVNYPLWRKITSWGYRTLLFFLFDLTVSDTQVGLKFFRKEVAKNVFPRILVKRFAFDVEVLAVATSLGYDKIYDAPIQLVFKSGSITSTNLLRTIMHMVWDTFAVFYRLKIVHYYDKIGR